MPIEIYLYGLSFFILGILLFFGMVYGCRYLGRKLRDKESKRG